MPIEIVPDQVGTRGVLGSTPQPVDTGDILGASFRQANTLVSMMQSIANSGPLTPEDGYTALPDIRETPYFNKHADRFAGSTSRAQTQTIKRQIDQEEADQATLHAAGATGVIMQMVAGSLDPTMALPGGVAVTSGKEGLTFFKAARNVGVAMGAQATVQEGLLHASQETRTLGESALNVASATILAGLLGGAAVKMLSPAEHAGVVKAMDRERAEMDAHAAGAPPPQVEIPVAGNENVAAAPMAAAAGAAASDTRQLNLFPSGIEKVPVLNKVMENIDPMTRTLTSESVAARRAAVDLAETPLGFVESRAGESTVLGGGPALDREARLNINQTRVAVSDTMDELWKDMRFAGTNVPWFAKMRDSMGMLGDSGMVPNFDQFKKLVGEAMQNGDKHDIPQVAQAAQFIRSRVFDPWKERAIKAGLLGEDIDVKTAESYFQRVYNKEAIRAKRPEFVNTVTDWLRGDQAKKAATKERLTGLQRELEAVQKQVKKANSEEGAVAAKARHDVLRKKIEAEIAAWEGKSVAEAKAAIKAREKYAAETARDAGKERLTSADDAIDKAVDRIIESDRDLSVAELRDRAHEISERILGSPAGRLPYDMGSGGPELGYHATAPEPPRGALAHRDFNIPDALIKPWLEQDVEHVVATHLRTMVPDVLLTEKFGDVRMTEVFRKIEDEYAAKIDATKSEKDRNRLGKEREEVLRDVAAIRDRIRGVYGMDVHNLMPNAARIASAAKNFNVLTSMGMATISSLPDMAGATFRYGLGTVFRDAYTPFFKSLVGRTELNGEALRQFRAMGIAIESFSAERHRALSDIMDNYKPQSRLERTLQWGADKFQFLNALGPWTDFGKVVASTVASQELFRAAEALTKGNATKKQVTMLAESSITPALAEKIAEQYRATGKKIDGVWLPNTEDWTHAEARRAFEGAVAREADIAIITPGQEKPLILSNPILSVLGQFKSFTAASTQRVLIANLQRRDAQVAQGVMFSIGLGMLSYKMNSMLGGQPTSDRPQDWIKEAISRGGMLGWIEEGNAIASKMTRGGVDMYRMIGSDRPLSRYAGRSVLDQILGPTAGKVEALSQVTGAIGAREWRESDTKALRKLTATQNLFYLRGLFNQIERGANNAFGIEMKAQ